MSKYDFSKEHAEGYLWAHKNRQRVSDEMFSKACAWIKPPPLGPTEMTQLLDILDENKHAKRGRPSKAAVQTRHNLAMLIDGLPVEKMPELLRKLLVERLKSGKRFYEFQRWWPNHKAWRKDDRDGMIRIFYQIAYDALKIGSPPVLHIIGQVDDSEIDKHLPTRDRAIALVAILMRKYTRYTPPSLESMQNLVGPKTLPEM